jgi:uridine kinase
VTENLEEEYEGWVTKISMDDYYRGKTYMQEEEKNGNLLNWDQPEALDLPTIRKHLTMLKAGIEIQKPIYCMKTSEKIDETTIKPNRIILLEGLFALNENVDGDADLKVFVEADKITRMVRRIIRDTIRTGQTPEDIIKYFLTTVEPMHEKYIESTKERANIIICNSLDAQKELR